MNPFVAGFSDELTKLATIEKDAGLVGSAAKALFSPVGKLIAKHPLSFLFGAVPAGAAAVSAYGKRVSGDVGSRVLQARPGAPSAYYNANFHQLLPHKLEPWQRYRLHANYPKYRERIGAKS